MSNTTDNNQQEESERFIAKTILHMLEYGRNVHNLRPDISMEEIDTIRDGLVTCIEDNRAELRRRHGLQ